MGSGLGMVPVLCLNAFRELAEARSGRGQISLRLCFRSSTAVEPLVLRRIDHTTMSRQAD
jgi:hypothetical protein